MKLHFRGNSALILGGSSAIGLAVAALLREEGLEPVLTHASDAGRAAIIERFPDLDAGCVRVDLGDPAGREALLPLLDAGVSYLVDLAQADREVLLASVGQAEAEAYFSAHVSGRSMLLKDVTRAMLARRFGRLVHVSSAAAALPAPGQGLYGAAKRAAEGLYQSVAVELGDRGISAVSLRLGLVDAGRGEKFLDRTGRRRSPSPKTVTLDQAASAICFLLSDEALAMTCTTITMDAGLTAQKYA